MAAVDADARAAHHGGRWQTFAGDDLVLAAGARANFFGTPGAEHAFPLYSMERRASACGRRSWRCSRRREREPGLVDAGRAELRDRRGRRDGDRDRRGPRRDDQGGHAARVPGPRRPAGQGDDRGPRALGAGDGAARAAPGAGRRGRRRLRRLRRLAHPARRRHRQRALVGAEAHRPLHLHDRRGEQPDRVVLLRGDVRGRADRAGAGGQPRRRCRPGDRRPQRPEGDGAAHPGVPGTAATRSSPTPPAAGLGRR